ncbi:MAG: hypothetical protein ABS35_25715 [Kaistia sp. SCN 65-12]|nr:MAG: hypothetical protein ABS35_25715 [Kaistia sp. SCN 65-12]
MHHTFAEERIQSPYDLSDLLAPEPTGNLAVALDLARCGFPVFPCQANKRPHTQAGFHAASKDLDQIRRWWARWPDAMPGLPTGAPSGVAVLDLDQHRADEDGIEALRTMGLDPDALSPLSIATPSGGRHIYFRWAEGMGNSARHLPPGIDIRGSGGYVIAPGAKLPDGRAYGSARGINAAALPAWPDTLMPAKPSRDPLDLSALLAPAPPPVDWSEIQSALTAIPADCGRENWFRVGMALHRASGGAESGFEIWDRWSASGEKYKPREMAGQWRSFGQGSGIDVGTLYFIANAYGWSRNPVISADDFDDLPDLPDAPKLQTPGPSLTFTTPDECNAVISRRYVVKGILAERDVACIVGAPGVGKSLLAPYLAYAVAQGREAFDSRIKSGGVMYVAAEDHHGMVARIQALRKEYGPADDFALVGGVSDLLSKDSPHLKELRLAVKERRPALIVIDTLAMAFPGLEENSAEGMGRVVAVARSLTTWGAAVVLVHHDTKDGQQGLPRGHSLLNGALDVAIHLKKDDAGIVRGKLTKNRNGSCDKALAFSIGVQTMGEDDDGDPATVALCREADPTINAYHEPKASRPERVALTVLRGIQPASRSEWREAAIENDLLCASDNPKSKDRAFERAVVGLTEKGLIRRTGDQYRVFDEFDEIDPIQSQGDDCGDRQRQTGDMSALSPMRKRGELATDSDMCL